MHKGAEYKSIIAGVRLQDLPSPGPSASHLPLMAVMLECLVRPDLQIVSEKPEFWILCKAYIVWSADWKFLNASNKQKRSDLDSPFSLRSLWFPSISTCQLNHLLTSYEKGTRLAGERKKRDEEEADGLK